MYALMIVFLIRLSGHFLFIKGDEQEDGKRLLL